jgi:hypothetical protein
MNCIKEYHEEEVLPFVGRFDTPHYTYTRSLMLWLKKYESRPAAINPTLSLSVFP